MKTILSIGAHPDDIEIGCGGTEIILQKFGYKLIHVIVTTGDEGDINIDKATLAHQRELEARESASVLNIDKIIFLRYPDGLTYIGKELKLRLITLIRRIQPEIVFTHASCDSFPDHHLVHQLSISAITAASEPWYPEVGYDPHTVSSIYGYEVWNPIQQGQLAVAIESVIDIKLKALACHRSQIRTIDYLSAVKGLAAYRGVMSRQSSYAEVFEVIRSHLTNNITSW